MNNKNINVNEYSTYITKLYRTIPKNSALIIRSKYNGKDVQVKTGGFALVAPWKESKLVSLAVKNFDYNKQKIEDHDGMDVIIDLAISVKVVDPIKYEYYHSNIDEELKQLITSSMRILINKNVYSNLKSKRFNISNYTCIGNKYYKNIHRNANGGNTGNLITLANYDSELEYEFDKELCEFSKRLDNFANRYGLKVVDLYNKEVQQTDEMQEAYNKKIIAEKEATAKMIEKDAELKRAEVDAKIIKIKAEAQAEADRVRYEAILQVLKDSNMSPEEQAKFLQAFMYSGGKDNVAGAAAAAVAGATAGITSTVNSKKR